MTPDPYRPPIPLARYEHRPQGSAGRFGQRVLRWLGLIGFFSFTLWVWFGVLLVVLDPHPTIEIPVGVAPCLLFPIYVCWVRAIFKGDRTTCFRCASAFFCGFVCLMLYLLGFELWDDIVTICRRPHMMVRGRRRFLTIGVAGIFGCLLLSWMACPRYLRADSALSDRGRLGINAWADRRRVHDRVC